MESCLTLFWAWKSFAARLNPNAILYRSDMLTAFPSLLFASLPRLCISSQLPLSLTFLRLVYLFIFHVHSYFPCFSIPWLRILICPPFYFCSFPLFMAISIILLFFFLVEAFLLQRYCTIKVRMRICVIIIVKSRLYRNKVIWHLFGLYRHSYMFN